MKNVKKRDGKVQAFDFSKPFMALMKVYTNGVKKEVPEGLVDKFETEINAWLKDQEDDVVNIEKVQDFLRDFLMKEGESEAAEQFILYREERSKYRESNTKLAKNIATKLFAKNVVNSNANLDENSFSGRVEEAASAVCQDFALKNSMSKMARKNHEGNMVYQHDLNRFAVGQHNCLTDPVDVLLGHGIVLKQCDIRPAGSLNTAFQLLAVNFQVQSLEQFGGISASHLDWTMVPYFRRSFYKHYRDIANEIPFMKWTIPFIDKENIKHTSINDKLYKGNGLSKKGKMLVWDRAWNATIKELKQAVEGFFHNMGSLQSRGGGQLPFSSINYGTCTLPEGRAVIKALIEGTIEGTGKYHRTSIFPCCIFQYSKNIHGTKENPGPNYDLFRLSLKATTQRDYPNYCNVDWSTNLGGNEWDRQQKKGALRKLYEEDEEVYQKFGKWVYEHSDYQEYLSLNSIYDALNDKYKITVKDAHEFSRYEIMSTMGCRTYNGYDINADQKYFLNIFKKIAETGKVQDNWLLSANQKDGRGNICPVTIIMPTLAMMAKETGSKDPIETFMKLLTKKIYEAKDMLIERFTLICSQNPKSAPFMWTNNTMVGYIPEEGPASAMKHGTLAIGQIGLAETLQILVGCNQTTTEGMELARRIEMCFKEKCKQFKEETKLNFGVYFTPAEGLCSTALKRFKEKYGVIPKVSDQEFFTNSIHVPVYEDIDCFKKIDIESQLTGYSNAGCITYVEMPSTATNNIDACEELVVYMMNKDIPYIALNFPLDYCRNCHSKGDFNGTCPHCRSHDIEELRRVTGYLSTDVSNMNAGKQDECAKRLKHVSKNLLN